MHDEVQKIKRRFDKREGWPQLLNYMTINGLRGWSGEKINFNFPIAVISGENGSGKSTILKCAAIAYDSLEDNETKDKPRPFYGSDFFPDTTWEIITGVTINYSIRQGPNDKNHSYNKKDRNWSDGTGRPKRNIIWLDIARTLPIDSTVGYSRLAKKKNIESATIEVDEKTAKSYSYILSRPYQNISLSTTKIDATRQVGVVTLYNKRISQFHQGAGEDATLDLLVSLQSVKNNSLILIDEVEASLHPSAQRKLIHHLLELARLKELQIILSTHSQHVLEELPEEARIFLQRREDKVEVLYGVSSNYALSKMDEPNHPDLYLFTEDQRATFLVNELLRKMNSVDMTTIKVTHVGPSNVVKTLGQLSKDNLLPIKSIGILDADENEKEGCIKLPGDKSPEKQIFNDILANQDATELLAKKLSLSQESIRHELSKSMTDPKHHFWVKNCAKNLNQSGDYLWQTMCIVWVEHCVTELALEKIASELNKKLNS